MQRHLIIALLVSSIFGCAHSLKTVSLTNSTRHTGAITLYKVIEEINLYGFPVGPQKFTPSVYLKGPFETSKKRKVPGPKAGWKQDFSSVSYEALPGRYLVIVQLGNGSESINVEVEPGKNSLVFMEYSKIEANQTRDRFEFDLKLIDRGVLPLSKMSGYSLNISNQLKGSFKDKAMFILKELASKGSEAALPSLQKYYENEPDGTLSKMSKKAILKIKKRI